MECLLGVCCRDFVVLAADCNAGRSIFVMKQDQDKLFKLDDRLAVVVAGESGDTTPFGEFIEKNVQLYKIRHGYSLSTHSAASFVRKQLADCLRRSPYFVNMLIGGHDGYDGGAALYFMDYLATMAKVPFGAHGYGSYLSLSILDKYYREDLTEQEAIELLGKCIAEIQKRLVLNMPNFKFHVIDKDGVRVVRDTAVEMES
ncbi:proteasome subunit beta type-2-like [Corticium candelabrum]|uniref:proteasome subunit beta type-2-like n=1 Tax=Corticium candelabrum TaxID=121492 RepID=UPI002E25BA94|nr:proteasome subunit beta type-2-like [Corticium candelabrum]